MPKVFEKCREGGPQTAGGHRRPGQCPRGRLRAPDERLRNETDVFKQRLADGESLDDLLPEAFAAVREASKRTLGKRHFDVQIMGGAALHQGNVAEMKTGEGKTPSRRCPRTSTP